MARKGEKDLKVAVREIIRKRTLLKKNYILVLYYKLLVYFQCMSNYVIICSPFFQDL